MAVEKKKKLVNFSIALVIAVVVVLLSKSGILQRLENETSELCFTFKGSHKTEQPIVTPEVTDAEITNGCLPQAVNVVMIFILSLVPALIVRGDNHLRDTALVFAAGVIYFTAGYMLFIEGYKILYIYTLVSLGLSAGGISAYPFFSVFNKKQKWLTESTTDRLTGLVTLRHFKILLDAEIKLVESGMAQSFVMAIGDIDDFRKFNDKYGRRLGDAVLKDVANSMKATLRGSDIVCRYGGEEICVLFKNTPLKLGFELSERLCSTVEQNSKSERKQY